MPGILGGSILKYARDEQKNQKHNARIASTEQIYVQKRIEKEPFFREFRRRVGIAYRLTHECLGKVETIDDVVHASRNRNETAASRFLTKCSLEREEEDNEADIQQGNVEFAQASKRRNVAQGQFKRWMKQRMNEEKGERQVRTKRITLSYMDEGAISRKRRKIDVTYIAPKRYQYIPEEDEEIIFEEEED